MKKLKLISIALILCLIAFTSCKKEETLVPQSAPEGFEKYLVYLTDITYNPADWVNGEYEYISGFSGTPFLESSEFHSEMMGRTTAEMDAQKEESIAFFKQRFGLDANDPALEGKITFFNFLFDPRIEYRAHTVSGEVVPNEGWKIWNSAWTIMILDLNGVELGGEFRQFKLINWTF